MQLGREQLARCQLPGDQHWRGPDLGLYLCARSFAAQKRPAKGVLPPLPSA